MANKTDKPLEQTGPESDPPANLSLTPGELVLDELAQTQSEFSPEDVDLFLNTEDPEFAKEMNEISKAKLSMIDIEIDVETVALYSESFRKGV